MHLVPKHGREDIRKENIACGGENREENKEEDVEHDYDGGDDAKYMMCRFPWQVELILQY